MSYLEIPEKEQTFFSRGFFILTLILAFFIGYILGSGFKSMLNPYTTFELIYGLLSVIFSLGFISIIAIIFINLYRDNLFEKKVNSFFQDEKIDDLINAMNKRISLVYSIKALGNLEGKAKKAVPFIINQLQNKRWYVRYHACMSLGKIKHKDAIPQLIKLIENDLDADVRGAAVYALSSFRKEFREKLPDILDIVKTTDDNKIHHSLLFFLSVLNRKEIIPIIESRISSSTDNNELYDFNCYKLLVEGLKSDSWDAIESLYIEGKISKKLIKDYLTDIRRLVYRERSKRKIKDSDEKDISKKIDITAEKTINILTREIRLLKKSKKILTILSFVIPSVIIGIFSIITTILWIKYG